MKINAVKTAFKIADVELVPNSTKLNFNYLKDLKDENGKEYPEVSLHLCVNKKCHLGINTLKLTAWRQID